jgi:hypothetical protein
MFGTSDDPLIFTVQVRLYFSPAIFFPEDVISVTIDAANKKRVGSIP